MFHLHDKIPAEPDIGVPDSLLDTMRKKGEDIEGEVVYIHPAGRYYSLRFTFPGGSWTEAKRFTEAELEAGRRLGMFPKMQRSRIREVRPPVGYFKVNELCFEDFDALSGADKAPKRQPSDEDFAAMF